MKIAILVALVAFVAAEPEADADAYYGYGLGHYGLGYHGIASYSPSASVHVGGHAAAAVPAIAGGYAAAGRYVANSAGVVHVAKRSADAEPEAEADADAYYGYGLGYYGHGYGLGYGYGHRLGYYGQGYGLGYRHMADTVWDTPDITSARGLLMPSLL